MQIFDMHPLSGHPESFFQFVSVCTGAATESHLLASNDFGVSSIEQIAPTIGANGKPRFNGR